MTVAPRFAVSPMLLVGEALFRGAALVLPNATARSFLPPGADLGPQSLTPPGTHPVVLHFNQLSDARLNVPNLLPSMTYHEVLVGVPFVEVTAGRPWIAGRGPFFYMPRLFLDQWLPIVGGLFWGFRKTRAEMTASDEEYTLRGPEGHPLARLEYQPAGPWRPAADPAFDAARAIMSQPLLLELPLGVGPCLTLANFDKKWPEATVRPLEASLTAAETLFPGMPRGRFPAEGRFPGFDRDPLGAFEMRAAWRLTLPRPWFWG